MDTAQVHPENEERGRRTTNRTGHMETAHKSATTNGGRSDEERRPWREEFDAAARRPLALRLKYAFILTYKPVLDDARYRAFDTMEEYRLWCNAHLPSWLGYETAQD